MANVNPPPSVETPPAAHYPSSTSIPSCDISELLSELNRVIVEREKSNDQNPTPGVDPAVLQQLQAVSTHMQTMNNRLSRTIWQMDNGFDGVHTRMNGLSNRLVSIENNLKTLISRSDELVSSSSPPPPPPPRDLDIEKAAEDHNRRARLQNRRINSDDKIVPLHTRQNGPIENFTPDTLYKLAYEVNQDKIVSWLQEFGQNTEKEGCQKRLIEFLGISQDQIAKCYN